MCNNLAYIGKTNNFKEVALKIKLGFIYGRENGKRGAGLMHNGKLYKNAGSLDSDAYDFVAKYDLSLNTKAKYNVVMAHNRAPSTGMGYSNDFTHPFVYGKEEIDVDKDGVIVTKLTNKMYFQHNGTITNIRDICKHYDLNFNDFGNDSKILGHLIYNGVNLQELFKMYEGGATCIWHYEGSRQLHMFKGATLEYNYVTRKDEQVDERPLYYALADGGVYFNSKKEILHTMLGHKVEVNNMINNNIITWSSNADEKLTIIPVNRNKKKIHAATQNYRTTQTNTLRSGQTSSNNSVSRNLYKNNSTLTIVPEGHMYDYRLMSKYQVVYYNSRYWYDQRIVHGEHYLKPNGEPCYGGDAYYFYKGILMRNKQAFEAAMANINDYINPNLIHLNMLYKYKKHNVDTFRYNNQIVGDYIIDDCIFCPVKIEMENGKLKKGNNFKPNHIILDHNVFFTPISEDQKVANYNQIQNTSFTNLTDVIKDYKRTNNVVGSLIPSSPYWGDFCTLIHLKTELMGDDYIHHYNDFSGTDFSTLFQCQNHYIVINRLSRTTESIIEFFDDLDQVIDKTFAANE